MDTRGLRVDELLDGCSRTNLDEWTALTLRADKVLVF
jgi:hypothetical protein